MSEINNPTPMNNSGNQPNNFNNNFGGQQVLPNSVGVLVLGICSIVLCWCYGIVSIVLGIVALVLANTALKLYNQNPDAYTLSSFKNLKAGRTCAIIGLCLSAVYIIYIIVIIIDILIIINIISTRQILVDESKID